MNAPLSLPDATGTPYGDTDQTIYLVLEVDGQACDVHEAWRSIEEAEEARVRLQRTHPRLAWHLQSCTLRGAV